VTPSIAVPRISVVVPTHNRAVILRQTIEALLKQDIDSTEFEIIVVDDGSTDATPQLAAELRGPGLTFIRREESGGPAAARNLGLRIARGEFVLFLDDDIIADRDLLGVHLRSHSEHDKVVVIGCNALQPLDTHPAAASLVADLQMQSAAAGSAPVDTLSPLALNTDNCSIRRDVLTEVGGFDETLQANEDYELALRLVRRGFVIRRVPEARGTELYSHGVDLFLVWQYRRGVAQARIAQKHPGAALDLGLGRFFSGSFAKRSARYALWLVGGFARPFLQTTPARAMTGTTRRASKRLPHSVLNLLAALHYWAGVRFATGSLASLRKIVGQV
jgi:glycosyltransferase involved in cell wall biosynthesis